MDFKLKTEFTDLIIISNDNEQFYFSKFLYNNILMRNNKDFICLENVVNIDLQSNSINLLLNLVVNSNFNINNIDFDSFLAVFKFIFKINNTEYILKCNTIFKQFYYNIINKYEKSYIIEFMFTYLNDNFLLSLLKDSYNFYNSKDVSRLTRQQINKIFDPYYVHTNNYPYINIIVKWLQNEDNMNNLSSLNVKLDNFTKNELRSLIPIISKTKNIDFIRSICLYLLE